MVERDVDLLLDYLESFPELKRKFTFSPPRVFWRDRWRSVRGIRKLPSGLEICCGGSGKLRLFPSTTVPSDRQRQKQRLLTLLKVHFSPVHKIKVLDKTDRNRHQTEAILRAYLKSSDSSMAILAVYASESHELSTRLLSSLVLWWDGFPGADTAVVFLPEDWSERMLELLPYVTIPVVCYKYRLESGKVRQIYPSLGEPSKLESPYVIYPMLSDAPELFIQLSREYASADLLFRHGRWELSYRGLPLVWSEEDGTAFFDVQHPRPMSKLSALRAHIQTVMDHRKFPPPVADHFCFRFGEERWLESLVLRDHRKINPEFAQSIYTQVPTWVGGERKVLDLLTATRQGRLAVLELKTQKDLNLLFQGLDYWERVEHHRIRADFGVAGYFSAMKLAPVPPLLYLICPLFEFHHVLSVIRSYLRKEFSVRCVGINTDWKRELKILRQFEL